ncbi:DNA/RNA helicase domain-containing protein [Microbacterium lacticum]
MTPSEIERLAFDSDAVSAWARGSEHRRNWPVVYVLDSGDATNGASVYVGETVNAASRMRQHLASPEKAGFRSVRVVIDETFNKSACLDLEAHLIRWLAGDGAFTVMNGNEGIVDAQYYERDLYREGFAEVFEQLRAEGIFQRSIPEIENSDLFKLSPFKVLTPEQAIAVEDIVDGLLEDLATGAASTSVIEGHPGTGKTIVAIFLMKTPRLGATQVVTPFDVGESDDSWDVLIVDETHRLNQRANQSSGINNKRFTAINERLFGVDDPAKTQLDWIRARSAHQIYLLDAEQTVRPADLPQAALRELVARAQASHRRYPLTTQMRVRAGADYVAFVRALVRGEVAPGSRPDLGDYELRLFDDLGEVQREILQRNAEHGLARLVAGYAWEWKSNANKDAFDIELDGVQLRWNGTTKDWINSRASFDEVGSIHTVQGYDLNYAGVIIGPDLRFDPATRRLFIDRESYRDKKGKENNKQLGIVYSDDDLLAFIRNIYGVLLTHGMRGTFVYVCDPTLRAYVASALGPAGRG